MPRAFIHDIKGGHQSVVLGSFDKTGRKRSQSGDFDSDLLCQKHEESLHQCDTYAVKWVRAFAGSAKLHPEYDECVYTVPNERPDLLLKFVCSVVWRHAMSSRMAAHKLDLGPWEPKLRKLIFFGSDYDPEFSIARRDLTVGGQPILPPIIFLPSQNPNWGKRGWEFEVGGFIWTLKLDSRRSGKMGNVLRANGCNPVPVWNLEPLPAVDRTGFLEVFANMQKPREYSPGT